MPSQRSPVPARSAVITNSKGSMTKRQSAHFSRRTTRRPPNGATDIRRLKMTDTSEYVPPKVWTWNKPSGGQFASINRPIAGSTHDKQLPVGKHPLQLYSLGTPNGVQV